MIANVKRSEVEQITSALWERRRKRMRGGRSAKTHVTGRAVSGGCAGEGK
jgi:hypothetical protein